jgi:short-subunit dehydrogenase
MNGRRLVLVTGASAGIGAAFARRYAQQGWDVALTARRTARLQELAASIRQKSVVETFCYEADLAAPGAVDGLLAAIARDRRQVDGLVNNAGYAVEGSYADTTWEQQAAFLQVMVTVPCELAHKVLPGMLERRFGRILNVASVSGLVPPASGFTLYAASKAALIRFSQGLNAECAGTGVHVTASCPGLTRSEFHEVNGTSGRAANAPEWLWQSAEQVVEESLAANERDQPVVVTGLHNKGVTSVFRLIPEPIAERLARLQAGDRKGNDRPGA